MSDDVAGKEVGPSRLNAKADAAPPPVAPLVQRDAKGHLLPGASLNPAGRPVGRRNNITGAQQDLLDAWNKVSGPVTSENLMRAALEQARDGKPGLLAILMPYIAKRMPETHEVGPIEVDDPEALLRRFMLCQSLPAAAERAQAAAALPAPEPPPAAPPPANPLEGLI